MASCNEVQYYSYSANKEPDSMFIHSLDDNRKSLFLYFDLAKLSCFNREFRIWAQFMGSKVKMQLGNFLKFLRSKFMHNSPLLWPRSGAVRARKLDCTANQGVQKLQRLVNQFFKCKELFSRCGYIVVVN